MSTRRDRTWTSVGEEAVEPSWPTLLVLHDGERGPVVAPGLPLRTDALQIGRSVGLGHALLADPRVSRRHAIVRAAEGGRRVVVEDRSRNGTFVNGGRAAEAELEDGDVLRVGDSFLMLRRVSHEPEDAEVEGIVGRAPAIGLLRKSISVVAPTDATVLVVGESGTGKELVARAIHERSGRPGPFVAVNCAAIPASLAESHLFGHVDGAFTGAHSHDGFFRAASGGTLFLDEVGELPLEVQPKLLRVLEDATVTPVGASSPSRVEVRVVAATNCELESAVDDGRFRGDVFARLAELTIRTPPLRERREDVLALFRIGYGEDHPPLSPSLVEALLLHEWRYNVRGLFKVAKELRIRGAGAKRLELRLVGHRLGQAADLAPAEPPRRARASRPPPPSRAVLEAMARECEGNVSKLARLLGRSRRQVHRYLESFGMNLEDYRSR